MADSTGDSSQSLALTTADSTGLVGLTADSSVSLLVIASPLTDTATKGFAGSSSEAIPMLAGEGQIEPLQAIPAPEATDGAGTTGSAGASDQFHLFDFQATGSGATAAGGSSVQKLPIALAEGSGISARIGASDHALPDLLASGTGYTSLLAESSQTLALIDASGAGIAHRLGGSDEALPLLAASSTGTAQDLSAAASQQTLALLTGSGTGFTARIGGSDHALPLLEGAATGVARSIAESTQALPLFEADGAGITSRLGGSTLTIPAVEGDGGVLGRMVGSSELVLPMWTGQGTAGGLAGGSILVLPAWIATGTGTNNAVLAGLATSRGQTYALHTQTNALSRDTASFNSYARLGAVLLAACDDGLYLLGAETDDGSPINAVLKMPLQDADSAQLRRVANLVVGYRAAGDLRLTLQTDDGESHEYVLESVGGAQCHPNRVKVGKGTKGRYWTATLENIAGADFAVDKADIDWQVLGKRV